jgi:hypothetical protein
MKSHPKFPDQLITSPIWGRADYVRLEAPFRFESDIVGTVTAEKGFDTDGASVPPVIRPIINPQGNLRFCSLPHDVLYWYQAVSCEPDARKVTRKEADQVIAEAMEAAGCGWLLRRTVYDQLRLWGGFAWDANVKRRAEEARTGVYHPVGEQIVSVTKKHIQSHFHKLRR